MRFNLKYACKCLNPFAIVSSAYHRIDIGSDSGVESPDWAVNPGTNDDHVVDSNKSIDYIEDGGGKLVLRLHNKDGCKNY